MTHGLLNIYENGLTEGFIAQKKPVVKSLLVFFYRVRLERGGHGGGDPALVKEFLSCVKEKRRPLADERAGMLSVAICEAGEKSVKENGKVIHLKGG